MRKILKFSATMFLFILAITIISISGFEHIELLTPSLVLSFLLLELLNTCLTEYKIKRHIWHRFSKKWLNSRQLFAFSIMAIVWALISLIPNGREGDEVWGINPNLWAAFAFLLLGLMNIRGYTVIFTKRTLQMNDGLFGEIAFHKIHTIQHDDEKLNFTANGIIHEIKWNSIKEGEKERLLEIINSNPILSRNKLK